jgi:hypothetical protein
MLNLPLRAASKGMNETESRKALTASGALARALLGRKRWTSNLRATLRVLSGTLRLEEQQQSFTATR